MAWAIEFRATAEKQLDRLGKREAARIVSYLEERIALHNNPRDLGIALKGSVRGAY